MEIQTRSTPVRLAHPSVTDGEPLTTELVRVSEPIAASFFFVTAGSFPTKVAILDSSGRAIVSESFPPAPQP